MGNLVNISFAGVDLYTDVSKLIRLYEKAPDIMEFGVLLSRNWRENGKRYFDPACLNRFEGKDLNLCAHLCGSIAREAVHNNWQPFYDLVGGHLNLFSRIQLNIAGYEDTNPEVFELDIPDGIKEIIIQQKSPDSCPLFSDWMTRHPENRCIVPLFDASGGTGTDTDVITFPDIWKAGYAGGIGPYNAAEKARRLTEDPDVHDFWLDMESKIRDPYDWFDVHKAETVLREVMAHT